VNLGDYVNVVSGAHTGESGVVVEEKNPVLLRVALDGGTFLIRISDLELE
jgi:ribosomal protein L24